MTSALLDKAKTWLASGKYRAWVPDRKVYAGGIAGLLAFVILTATKKEGYDPQPVVDLLYPPVASLLGLPQLAPGAINAQTLLTGAITVGIGYIIPQSKQDIFKRLNDAVVAEAAANPNVPVSAPKAATTA